MEGFRFQFNRGPFFRETAHFYSRDHARQIFHPFHEKFIFSESGFADSTQNPRPFCRQRSGILHPFAQAFYDPVPLFTSNGWARWIPCRASWPGKEILTPRAAGSVQRGARQGNPVGRLQANLPRRLGDRLPRRPAEARFFYLTPECRDVLFDKFLDQRIKLRIHFAGHPVGIAMGARRPGQ